jgi:hypothetical protein
MGAGGDIRSGAGVDDERHRPAVRVVATLIDPAGEEVGTHEQPMLWHPIIYRYGRNWLVPGAGDYVLRVRVDPRATPATMPPAAVGSSSRKRSSSAA